MLRMPDLRAWGETLYELAVLEKRYESASLDALFASLAPRRITYARDWAAVERLRALTAMLAGRLPFAGSMGACLKLAIVRYALLRRRGLNVNVHLGVRPSPAGLTGHAWLTLNGEALWEDPAQVATFRETFRHPPAESAARL